MKTFLRIRGMNEIYRIIDANLNRASEALRTLEDWSRFALNNKEISQKLKNIRHELNQIFSTLSNLILYRDATYDIGKTLENTSQRTSAKDVISANCKRLEQSLRVLAEYGQMLNLEVRKLEEQRYEVYTLEKELTKNEKLLRLHNSLLYLVTSRTGIDSDEKFLNILEKTISGGVDIIQLREKETKEKDILDLAHKVKRLTDKHNVLFIINDRIDIALAVSADGVHLGQADLPLPDARQLAPEGFLIGLSTHFPEQGQKSMSMNPDYIGIGPVFQTPTKPDYIPAGLDYVKWASENIKNIPWFAIGGIDETNIDKVINAGGVRIAVVRAIMNSNSPQPAAKKLKEALSKKGLLYAKTSG